MAIASPNTLWFVGFAAPQIVIVQRRQIVVDQRIRVDEFQRAADLDRSLRILREHSRRFEAQNRPNPLAARKYAVPHRAMNR